MVEAASVLGGIAGIRSPHDAVRDSARCRFASVSDSLGLVSAKNECVGVANENEACFDRGRMTEGRDWCYGACLTTAAKARSS